MHSTTILHYTDFKEDAVQKDKNILPVKNNVKEFGYYFIYIQKFELVCTFIVPLISIKVSNTSIFSETMMHSGREEREEDLITVIAKRHIVDVQNSTMMSKKPMRKL